MTTLAPTLLGGLLAIAGGVIGQWRADARAAGREQRERDHEREVWARGLRYEPHIQFLATLDQKYKIVQDAQDANLDDEAPHDFLAPVWDRTQLLRLVCEEGTTRKAEEAFDALREYTYKGGAWEQVDWARDQYVGAVRAEFHLPPIALMGDD